MPRRVVILDLQAKQYRARFFRDLAARLARDDVQLTVAYSEPNARERAKRDAVELPADIGVKVPAWWFARDRLVVQAAWGVVRGADLVIVEQSNRALFNLALVALSALHVRRVAFWGHGYDHQRPQRGPSAWLKRQLLDKVTWWFAYTESVQRYLVERGVEPARISTVYNTIDSEEHARDVAAVSSERASAVRARLNIPATARVGLYCGALYEHKHIPFLLEAAARIHARDPSFVLLVIGDGPQRALVEDASSAPYVRYVGPRFGRDRAEYFAISDVLLMPGLVGLAVVDAFAAGLPVITTDVPIHSPEIEYVRAGENGILCAHDVGVFADEVSRLLADRDRLQHMQHEARATARTLTLDRMVEAFRDGIVRALEVR